MRLSETDADQLADFRVEIELSSDPAFAADPYVPAPYDETPRTTKPGWYAGDMHVHAEHSALGDATMTEVFDYAFTSFDDGGAGLDFITLSDYVIEQRLGRDRPLPAAVPGQAGDPQRRDHHLPRPRDEPRQRALRGSPRRTGPSSCAPNGDRDAAARRALRPSAMLAAVVGRGRHRAAEPRDDLPVEHGVLPPHLPRLSLGLLERRDAIQRGRGDRGPIRFVLQVRTLHEARDRVLGRGVGGAASTSPRWDRATRTRPGLPTLPSSAIGRATTVVYANSLSEQGILDGVRAGHTYVKLFGNDGPDLRLDAIGDEGGTGIMGDAIPDRSATLVATVIGIDPAAKQHFLKLYRNGVLVDSLDGRRAGGVHRVPRGIRPVAIAIQLERDRKTADEPAGADVIVVLTSPVYVPEPGAVATMLACWPSLLLLRRGRGPISGRGWTGARARGFAMGRRQADSLDWVICIPTSRATRIAR